MKLHFVEKHKSVESFNDVEISDFAIFTGENGSGKTHVLEAINEGKITVDDLPKNKILYLNYLDFAKNFQRNTDLTDCNNAWTQLNDEGNLLSKLKNNEGIIKDLKPKIEEVAKEKQKKIFDLRKEDFEPENSVNMIDAISNYRQTIEDLLYKDDNLGNEQARSVYESVISKSKVFLSNVKEADFRTLYRKTAFGNEQILSDLSSVFFGYYTTQEMNKLYKANNEDYLEDEEFLKEYGTPPWELIRNIFTGFNLNFDVNDPIEDKISPMNGTFKIEFKHTGKNNIRIPFNDLSSGEKILITLINAIYTSEHKNGLPKLILLDEIDGPLNPSVLDKFVSYLEDNFLSNDIKLILATHTPSTIAFSPEDSTYIVRTAEDIPIKQVDNRKGIKELSQGYVTLSDILEFNKIQESTIIISEGKNFTFLNKAKDIYECRDVAVLNKSIGGTSQLRTLFEFLRDFNSEKIFLFVFDCDYRLKEKRDNQQGIIKDENGNIEYEDRDFELLKDNTNNNNRIFIFSKNDYSASDRGIENLFNTDITDSFIGGFNEKGPKNKKQFEKYILERNEGTDFKNFHELFTFLDNNGQHNL